MGRTINETKILGRNLEETRKFIINWFNVNEFNIKDYSFKGKYLFLVTWLTIPGFLLSPNTGAIVAVRPQIYGCIVFEISLEQDSNNVIVHGEFYVAGSTFMLGQEWDLKPISPNTAKIAREEGHYLMSEFIRLLKDFSVISSNFKNPQNTY